MPTIAPQIKPSNNAKKEHLDIEDKNKRRIASKQIAETKRADSMRLKELVVTGLVILGLLTLIVASFLKDGLFLKELVACSLIIGGVLFVRAFNHSTAHKSYTK